MALSWKHVVPWANRSEFVETYLDLYSKNSERQMKGVESIALWKCRAPNKLSVAIESSAALTKAHLLYQSALGAGELRQRDFELCYVLTLALIRFVNHVTEKGQNKAFAQPVHKIAQEFGIPEWIVRLRHEGTHGSIPCLDMLSKGVQWALTYLQDVFWSQQVKEADEVTDPSTRKRKRPAKSLYNTEEIQELLLKYQKSSYKSMEDGPDSEMAREEKRSLRRLEYILNGQQRNNVLRCVVESGHLLPTEQQLQAYHVNLSDTFQATPARVPEVLIKVWKEFLQVVQAKQLTGMLLQHMVAMMVGGEGGPSSLQGQMLAAWLRLVLLYENSNYSKMAAERESQVALYDGAIDFSKDLLLVSCLQSPSSLTCSILRLVDSDSISEDAYRQLDELDRVYRGDPGTEPADKDHSDEDADMREEGETLRKGASPSDSKHKLTSTAAKEDGNLWTLCTDPVDWEWVPIGVLPGDVCTEELGPFYSSSEEEGRSSEDEPDTATLDRAAQNSRERSSEKSLKEDSVKDIGVH